VKSFTTDRRDNIPSSSDHVDSSPIAAQNTAPAIYSAMLAVSSASERGPGGALSQAPVADAIVARIARLYAIMRSEEASASCRCCCMHACMHACTDVREGSDLSPGAARLCSHAYRRGLGEEKAQKGSMAPSPSRG
jgi:hypothetical protein